MDLQHSIDYLKTLSTSPYNPEIPRKHLLVNCFMGIARLCGAQGTKTPHLYKGDNLSKVLYEYNNAFPFLEFLKIKLGPNFLNDKVVLDVGCGWGGKDIYYCEHTKLKAIVGFDMPGIFDPAATLKFASTKNINNCFFTTAYAESIPFKNNRFDIIIMEDVLEHVKDPERVLQECFRVLKQDGKLIVKFPSFKGMLSHHLDRAINLPALHYILPMKIWAQGLNYLLLVPKYKLSYEPFDEVISTPYCKSITHNLNGLNLRYFKDLITKTGFKDSYRLELVPFTFTRSHQFVKPLYDILWKCKKWQEFLSSFIFFIGDKKY